MNGDPAEARYRIAEAALAEYLERVESGEPLSFQAWKESRAEVAFELARLHAEWQELEEALADPAVLEEWSSSSHIEMLRELEPTDALLFRLRAQSGASNAHATGQRLGAGGMGEVFVVRDAILRRELAMKVLRSDPVDTLDPDRSARRIARFLEEAQIMGQLDHPGIVPVHELGVDAAGRPFMTMKRVRGRTLASEFARLHEQTGEFGPEASTRVRCLTHLVRVCEAMAYAHSRGVIHRDLKPSNIMVGYHGEVYVMDWGLARVLAMPPDSSALLTDRSDGRHERANSDAYTLSGQGLGTAQYMPPEQALGRWSEVDGRVDVYAMGAILYHAIAGRAPYSRPPGSAEELRARVIAGPPESLSRLAPDAPAELVAICERAMARDRSVRYADIASLAADLSAYLEHRVVSAHRTGPWAEARKWIERNTSLAVAILTATMLALGGLGSVSYVQAVERGRAEVETARVKRLADAKVLRDLELEADQLWPPHPDLIPSLESWLVRANDLIHRLDAHRAVLAGMRERARSEPLGLTFDSPGTGSLGISDRLERLGRLEASLGTRPDDGVPSSAPTSGPSLEDELDARIGLCMATTRWRFSSLEEQWHHDMLSEFLLDAERLQDGLMAADTTTPHGGWSIPKRLGFARGLARDFSAGGRFSSAWERDLPAIRAAYPGLDVRPQMGLVPLGPDPTSGLWEFAHLATGEPAVRDAFGRLQLNESTGVVLVLIPGGPFWMGSQGSDSLRANFDPQSAAPETPAHLVQVSPYFLAKFEMTVSQWQRVNGSGSSASGRGSTPAHHSHPVGSVSWHECMDTLGRVGLVLPSEAQWEFGCRAGSSTPWWTGSERASLEALNAANIADQAAARAGMEWPGIDDWPELDDGHALCAPVGSFRANAFGLHDVAGNVWEWCLDGYDADFYAASPASDPVAGWAGRVERVYRGGSFSFAAKHCRSARRAFDAPTIASLNLGLRAARGLSK